MLSVKFASDADPKTNVSIAFYAADRRFGEVVFHERLLFDIGRLIQQSRTYGLNETMKEVTLPSGQEIEGEFLFIIAKSIKENLDFGILFNKLETGGYHIIGLWPRDFSEICKTDHEVFEFLMFRLINTPEFFSKVTLYQPLDFKIPVKPPLEVPKPAPPPVVPATPTAAAEEVRPAPPPEMTTAAAEVKEIIKPPEVEIKPPPTPTKVEYKPPAGAAVETHPDLLEGRCPFCKAALPEPRLQVLQRGNNTFCPKCLKILKGFKAPVDITPVVEVGITTITKRELEDFVKQAEQALQRKDYGIAASNYRKGVQKANLLGNKKYAKDLELQADKCQKMVKSTRIQEIMKSADDYFRQKSYNNAIKEYKIAIDLAKMAKDNTLLKTINARIRQCAELIVTEKIEGFINLAEQQLKDERYAEAKQNFIEALELEKRIGEKDLIRELEQKVRDCDETPLKKKLKHASAAAQKQFQVEKYDDAARFYREAASFASQLNDRDAQRFFEQKIVECETGPQRQRIQDLLRTADSKLQSKDFDAATEIYRQALSIATDISDKNLVREIEGKMIECGTGDADTKLQNILLDANNYFAQKDYSSAKKRYQEGILVAKQAGKSDSVKSMEEKIQGCTIQEKIIQAEDNYQNQNYEAALKLYNDVHKLAKNINEMASFTKAATRIREIQHVIFNQSLTRFVSQADQLLSEQNFAEAKKKLEQAQKLATRLNDTAKLQEINEKLAQIK